MKLAPPSRGRQTRGGQHIAHYENNETYFVHSGRLGTAGIVTDYSGAVIQDELHYPWGQEWTGAGTMMEERFASLNHRDAATNLDPTHFRMYSSDQGRWLTPDPAQADIYNPQSMSRYAYAINSPLNATDPSGLFIHCPYGQTNNHCNPPPVQGTAGYPGCVAYGTEGCIQPPCGVMPGVVGCPQVFTTSAGGGAYTPLPPPPSPPTVAGSVHQVYLQWKACVSREISAELGQSLVKDGLDGKNPNSLLELFGARLRAQAECLREFPLAALDPEYEGPLPGDVFIPPLFSF